MLGLQAFATMVIYSILGIELRVSRMLRKHYQLSHVPSILHVFETHPVLGDCPSGLYSYPDFEFESFPQI